MLNGTTDGKSGFVITQGDIVDDTKDEYQEFDLVPLGPIEKIAKVERSASRGPGR
jgi:hypothetical protein